MIAVKSAVQDCRCSRPLLPLQAHTVPVVRPPDPELLGCECNLSSQQCSCLRLLVSSIAKALVLWQACASFRLQGGNLA